MALTRKSYTTASAAWFNLATVDGPLYGLSGSRFMLRPDKSTRVVAGSSDPVPATAGTAVAAR